MHWARGLVGVPQAIARAIGERASNRRMIDEERACEIATAWIARHETNRLRLQRSPDSPVKIDEGWLFYWNSVEFYATRDIMTALGGTAPFVVFADTGEVAVLGTARPTDVYLQALRKFGRAEMGSERVRAWLRAYRG